MQCPNCGTFSPPGKRFCSKCGTELVGNVAATTPVNPVQPQVYPATQMPAYPSNPPGYPAPQPQMQPQPYAPQRQQPYGASGSTFFNIWGPFAGYGTRRRHVGWLMNGEGQRAPDVQDRVEQKFRDRDVPGTRLTRETLTSMGIVAETRPYFMLRRGLVTLALYVAQFGRDLYISQVSYLKMPISNFRVLLLLGMLLFFFFSSCVSPILFSVAAQDVSSSLSPFGGRSSNSSGTLLFFLFCCVGPLGTINSFALLTFFGYSFYKWLTIKDFFAALRVPSNEFHEDDLMAMEKAVEETVRQSLTDLKLNPNELQKISVGQGGQLF